MVCVLLVDDRAENRESLTALLADSGYQVRQASDVDDAVARLRGVPIDLVMTDMRMG